jgi:nitroreductase
MGMVRAVVTHRLAPLFSGVDYPWIDLGIAGEHLVLQATELGLGTCWVGWIRPAAVRKAVGWPRSIRPAALVTAGWPRNRQDDPGRPRKSLSELTTWDGASPDGADHAE